MLALVCVEVTALDRLRGQRAREPRDGPVVLMQGWHSCGERNLRQGLPGLPPRPRAGDRPLEGTAAGGRALAPWSRLVFVSPVFQRRRPRALRPVEPAETRPDPRRLVWRNDGAETPQPSIATYVKADAPEECARWLAPASASGKSESCTAGILHVTDGAQFEPRRSSVTGGPPTPRWATTEPEEGRPLGLRERAEIGPPETAQGIACRVDFYPDLRRTGRSGLPSGVPPDGPGPRRPRFFRTDTGRCENRLCQSSSETHS